VNSDPAIAGGMPTPSAGSIARAQAGRGSAELNGTVRFILMSVWRGAEAVLDVMIEKDVPVHDCQHGYRKFLRRDG
jgi:hypothetical protein